MSRRLGFGYYAGPATTGDGLGRPNGAPAGAALEGDRGIRQISYSRSPDMLDAHGGGWTQRHRPDPAVPNHVGDRRPSVGLVLGAGGLRLHQRRLGAFAWASRLAQQVAAGPTSIPTWCACSINTAQGSGGQSSVSQGDSLLVTIDAAVGRDAIQGALSSGRSASPTS